MLKLKTLKLIKRLREKEEYSYNRISNYLNDNNIKSKNNSSNNYIYIRIIIFTFRLY